MSEAAIFRSFGPEAYQPEGQPYAQVPRIVLEKLCPWLDALVSAFEGRTLTYVTRKEFKKYLPENLQTVSERTVTNKWRLFGNLFGDKDGIIHRERDKENGNLWRMTWTVPLQAKERNKPATAEREPGTAQAGVPIKPLSEESIVSLIQLCWASGWRVVSIDGKRAELKELDGKEQTALAAGHQELFNKHNSQVAAYHKVQRVQRE